MNWHQITSESDLQAIVERSQQQQVLIFKHSTRCAISKMALDRLERAWKDEEMSHVAPFFLDLLTFRPLSNRIAEDYGIMHESPQVLLIVNGNCVYHASHSDINYRDLKTVPVS